MIGQPMTAPDSREKPTVSAAARTIAFCVHVLTAVGGGLALLALLEAVREHWAMMFVWLGLALVLDAIDGPIARWLDVARVLPQWSGETLDLVVDFVTYVFVPAYAITASGLLLPLAAPVLGGAIVVTGALYFSDRRMKVADHHFRGFPALWNAAAFYLFLLKPAPVAASLGTALLIVLTFAPFHVIHPVRVRRLRGLSLLLILTGAALALFVIVRDFRVPLIVSGALCAIGGYILGSDLVVRLVKRMMP